MAKVESSGIAKAGLTTGIIGTSLAGLLTLGQTGGLCGLLGGLGGNNNCYALSAKDAEIAQLKSEKYADSVGQGVYAAINTNLKEAYTELVATRERLATADANFKCLASSVDRIGANVSDLNAEVANMRVREQRTHDAIECAKKEFGSALALESERRTAGDQNLMCYVNATFVPGKLVMPRSSICPEVMREYNSWTAPTGTAPATQPVSGTVTANVV